MTLPPLPTQPRPPTDPTPENLAAWERDMRINCLVWRRRLIAWLRLRYSDGSTLANVCLRTGEVHVPRPVPWWMRWI